VPVIHFITKGDRKFGTGHLHRTSWLHTILSQHPDLRGQVSIWCNDDPLSRAHFATAGLHASYAEHPTRAWLDARTTGDATASGRSVCVLDKLDNYPETVLALRAAGAKVVLLDDYGPAQPEADLVINSLLAPLAGNDEQFGRARLLSGSKYIALSPGVTRLRGIANALNKSLAAGPAVHGQLSLADATAAAPSGQVHGILVSGGGSGNTLVNTLALAALPYTAFDGLVNVMPDPNGRSERKQLGNFTVAYHPAGPGFHDLLASSDLAIIAGGISLYEAAFLGIPAIVVPIAAHQLATAHKLAKAGTCVVAAAPASDLAHLPLLDPAAFRTVGMQLHELLADTNRRQMMSQAGQELLDGRGLMRTAAAILEMSGVHTM
jgi:spore coat polysaccharide biosynthesis predicted glycosyltransferase SpsG